MGSLQGKRRERSVNRRRVLFRGCQTYGRRRRRHKGEKDKEGKKSKEVESNLKRQVLGSGREKFIKIT